MHTSPFFSTETMILVNSGIGPSLNVVNLTSKLLVPKFSSNDRKVAEFGSRQVRFRFIGVCSVRLNL